MENKLPVCHSLDISICSIKTLMLAFENDVTWDVQIHVIGTSTKYHSDLDLRVQIKDLAQCTKQVKQYEFVTFALKVQGSC